MQVPKMPSSSQKNKNCLTINNASFASRRIQWIYAIVDDLDVYTTFSMCIATCENDYFIVIADKKAIYITIRYVVSQ